MKIEVIGVRSSDPKSNGGTRRDSHHVDIAVDGVSHVVSIRGGVARCGTLQRHPGRAQVLDAALAAALSA